VFSGAASAKSTRQGISSETSHRDEKSNLIRGLLLVKFVIHICVLYMPLADKWPQITVSGTANRLKMQK